MKFIIFEKGSADWVSINRVSGFCKSQEKATRFENKTKALWSVVTDNRYLWLYQKGTLQFQVVKK